MNKPAPGLKKQSVLLNLLYSLLSLGVYLPLWFLLRLKGFNQLNPQKPFKAWPLMGVLVISVLDAVLTILDLTGWHKVSLIGMLLDQLFFQLLSLAGFAILTLECFKLKHLLEEAYEVRLDPVLLLLFSIWYLQHWINHLVERKPLAGQLTEAEAGLTPAD